ncbi:GntR family transcriptional regulator [Sciscionella marina]|uniref:GntR family transcriptional regulator n=1 Tax=Sciscionella marina TaxID=508770 RepID=UPI0003791BD9|nr:GntR family transcriptional regulator [Sciscionella marina]
MTRTQAGKRTENAQEIAYRWLRDRVASVPRSEGVFLTEGQVAEASGISRTPVREALLRLEAEGLLQIVPKKGAFVPPVSDAELRSVMQARTLIEDWSVRRVAEAPDTVLGELERLLGEQEKLLADPVEFIECDRTFHRTIVIAAGNPVLVDFYESLRERQLRMGLRAVAGSTDRARVVLTEHAAIVDGLRSGSVAEVTGALDRHLERTLAALSIPDSGVRR